MKILRTVEPGETLDDLDAGDVFTRDYEREEIRKKLLSRLMDLSPAQFEELVGRQLLAEMGFESIEVTKYGGDGGIDVRGTLLISNVIRIKMAVQVKRWKKGNRIHSPTIQQVRGSLGVHEQGLIITTSDFSDGAIKEADQPDKTPVGLMNGEHLVTLLMEYNIGVRRMSHDLFELEELPIGAALGDAKTIEAEIPGEAPLEQGERQ